MITSDFLIRYFWIHMHTYWELRILGQKAVFLWFFDKNIIFSSCVGYAEIFSFVYGESKLLILILDDANA